ncbi:MAG TPA: FAD-dependent oxidoreductase [Candidatus Eremiobacteraceae bacterium]|nr:FAD-dependent oxidoreductase [Candidatus Eremiobacteraceae bacterium]
MNQLATRCCITGGGPAGVMLGYLLARSGIDVVVLEKHKDFFRDFRGDTVHPSTLAVLQELGLLDEFLKLRHSEVRTISVNVSGDVVTFADLRYVPGPCKFVAFVPQWDLLNFLAEHGRRYPSFHLLMETEARSLITEDGIVKGIVAQAPEGELHVRADLTVAADGRTSTLREQCGGEVIDIGAPIDALWFRLSKRPGDPRDTFGNVVAGGILVAIDRVEYYQCAMVIKKGGFDTIRSRGLDSFRNSIGRIAPYLADRVGELQDWDDVKLLTVAVNRLKQWHRPGLLFIGDAAHAMSPVGGIGINLAIQDAVASSNLLTPALLRGAASDNDLQRVQERRERPTRQTQALQVFLQERILNRVLGSSEKVSLPWFIRLFNLLPVLRAIPARTIGIGFLPEHVRTRETASPATDGVAQEA